MLWYNVTWEIRGWEQLKMGDIFKEVMASTCMRCLYWNLPTDLVTIFAECSSADFFNQFCTTVLHRTIILSNAKNILISFCSRSGSCIDSHRKIMINLCSFTFCNFFEELLLHKLRSICKIKCSVIFFFHCCLLGIIFIWENVRSGIICHLTDKMGYLWHS
jgi:hypothetical protein